MPFGMVSGVGRGCIRWGGDRRRARGCFGDEFGAFDCKLKIISTLLRRIGIGLPPSTVVPPSPVKS